MILKVICIILVLIFICMFMLMSCRNAELGNSIDRAAALYLMCGGNTCMFRFINSLILGTNQSLSNNTFNSDIGLVVRFMIANFNSLNYCNIVHALPIIQYRIQEVADRSTLMLPNAFTTIVIHLRCSDVPFLRNPEYHIYRFNAFVRAIQLAGCGFDRVEILNSTSHKCDSAKKNVCMSMGDALKLYIESKTNLKCKLIRQGSLCDDVKRMTQAGCLIGFTGSLIYYTGLAKKQGIFISSQQSVVNHMYHLDVSKDVIMHDTVPDYYDTCSLFDRLCQS